VINRKAAEGAYVTSWEEFEFLPGALKGLALLARTQLPIIVATNQRGIARGRMTGADLADIHRRMRAAIIAAGGRLDAVYYCPHETGCRCRKPEVGMFESAAAQFGLRLAETAVVGDQPTDMLAAERIGAMRVLVAPRLAGSSMPVHGVDHLAGDLLEAARFVLGYQLAAGPAR